MTVAETSPAWFTMLPPFGDESPMPPPRPTRLSTPVNGLVDNPATLDRFEAALQ